MRYEDVYKMKKHSLEECLALIESGDTIAVSGVATEPTEFLSRFTEIVPRLRDVTVIKSKDNEYEYLREREMTYADVEGKSAEELRLMRNYIFARRGYIFESEDLKEYFEQFSWYVPLYYDVTPRLSDIEKYNVNFIKEYETDFGPDYTPEYEY